MNNKQTMTRTTELLKEIHNELEKGITRNKVLPLDWAMDRIEPIVEKGLNRGRLDALKDELLFLEGDDIIGCIIEADYGSCHEIPKWYLDRLASIQEEIKLIEEKI